MQAQIQISWDGDSSVSSRRLNINGSDYYFYSGETSTVVSLPEDSEITMNLYASNSYGESSPASTSFRTPRYEYGTVPNPPTGLNWTFIGWT